MKKEVLFVVSKLTSNVASVRYRALIPALYLDENNCNIHIIQSKNKPKEIIYDVVFFIKTFTVDDIDLARNIKTKNPSCFIAIDLCDNIFDPRYHNARFDFMRPAAGFVLISGYTDLIIVTTPKLKELIESYSPNCSVTVLPDTFESLELLERQNLLLRRVSPRKKKTRKLKKVQSKLKNIRCKFEEEGIWKSLSYIYFLARKSRSYISWKLKVIYRKMKNKLYTFFFLHTKKIEAIQGKKILWFGNHAAGELTHGINEINILKDDLEKISLKHNISLIVISNSREAYSEHIKKYKIPSYYYEWTSELNHKAITLCDCIIIPSFNDEFSKYKSPNRLLMGIGYSKPVITSKVDSFLEYEEYIYQENWYASLDNILSNSDVHQAKLEKIKSFYPPTMDPYLDIVNSKSECSQPEIQIIIYMDLLQDFNLFEPFINFLDTKGDLKNALIFINESLLNVPNNNNLLKFYQQKALNIIPLREESINITLLKTINTTDFNKLTLLSCSESNLNPHRRTRKFVAICKSLGMNSYTFQHGLENVGLTYSDQEYPIKNVNFISDKIFTWGNSYHSEIPEETLKKCIPLGTFKKKEKCTDSCELIGIFENLHWNRYSDEYRINFLNMIKQLVTRFPKTQFVLVEHPAGRYFSKNKISFDYPNLNIERPKNIMGFICQIKGLITTPSSIALDAALQNAPVFVVTDQTIDPSHIYSDLSHGMRLDQAVTFIEDVFANRKIEQENFLSKHLIDTDTAEKFYHTYIGENK